LEALEPLGWLARFGGEARFRNGEWNPTYLLAADLLLLLNHKALRCALRRRFCGCGPHRLRNVAEAFRARLLKLLLRA
jgi:hypothetical protein